MKRFLIGGLIVLGLGFVLAYFITIKAEQDAATEQSNYLTYENKGAGFTIDYPNTWQFSKDENNLTYFQKSSVATGTESIQATVMVGIFAHNQSLEEASEETEEFKDASEQEGIDITKENIEINGFPAIKYVVDVNIEDKPGKVMRTLIKKGDEVYGFDYSNSLEMFDVDLPVVTKMIESFRNN